MQGYCFQDGDAARLRSYLSSLNACTDRFSPHCIKLRFKQKINDNGASEDVYKRQG